MHKCSTRANVPIVEEKDLLQQHGRFRGEGTGKAERDAVGTRMGDPSGVKERSNATMDAHQRCNQDKKEVYYTTGYYAPDTLPYKKEE